jgi:GTP cyclohydrolase IB
MKTIVTHASLDNFHKDPSGLTDFHRIIAPGAPAIDRVGINRFRVPALFRHKDGSLMNHDAEAAMYVACPAGHTGINMSRLCAMVLEEIAKGPVDMPLVTGLLGRFRREMRNTPEEELFPASFFELSFLYPIRQKALKSGYEGWQYYATRLSSSEDAQGRRKVYLVINYEYSSACPCSLAMSKQYEKEYAQGKTEEGVGTAVAHSQRSNAKVTVEIAPAGDLLIEDVVNILRDAIPTETQAFAKRVDEQAFAVLNGENPLFVEHAARRLHKALNGDPRLLDWSVEIEHWESLHSHNAAARIAKGVVGGLS